MLHSKVNLFIKSRCFFRIIIINAVLISLKQLLSYKIIGIIVKAVRLLTLSMCYNFITCQNFYTFNTGHFCSPFSGPISAYLQACVLWVSAPFIGPQHHSLGLSTVHWASERPISCFYFCIDICLISNIFVT